MSDSVPNSAPRPRESVLSAWAAFDGPVRDYGLGLVAVREQSRPLPRIDTLVFRSAASRTAPEIALLLVRSDTAASPNPAWQYAIAAPESLTANLVEFDYEIAGVPVDSVVTDGAGDRWVRGLLGQTSDGRWHTGWAEIDTSRVLHIMWADRLKESGLPLFALDSAGPTLSAAVDGPPVSDVPKRDLAIYATDTVVGQWLRVRAVWPTDECLPRDSIPRTERRLWLRYLDARGRPAVWYHSRGC